MSIRKKIRRLLGKSSNRPVTASDNNAIRCKNCTSFFITDPGGIPRCDSGYSTAPHPPPVDPEGLCDHFLHKLTTIGITRKGVAFVLTEANIRSMNLNELLDSWDNELARDALGEMSFELQIALILMSKNRQGLVGQKYPEENEG